MSHLLCLRQYKDTSMHVYFQDRSAETVRGGEVGGEICSFFIDKRHEKNSSYLLICHFKMRIAER